MQSYHYSWREHSHERRDMRLRLQLLLLLLIAFVWSTCYGRVEEQRDKMFSKLSMDLQKNKNMHSRVRENDRQSEERVKPARRVVIVEFVSSDRAADEKKNIVCSGGAR